MVKNKSNTRLSSLVVPVILSRTDTTVGFLSQDDTKLYTIKSRHSTKPFIKIYVDFKTLKAHKHRVPNRFKNTIRRAKKTTFIVKNRAFRIAQPTLNSQVLRNIDWHYSTSANESGKTFNREFCEKKADIIIEDKYMLSEATASEIIKVNKLKKRRLR